MRAKTIRPLVIATGVVVTLSWLALQLRRANQNVEHAIELGENARAAVGAEYRELTDGVDKGELGRDAADGIRDIGAAAKARAIELLDK